MAATDNQGLFERLKNQFGDKLDNSKEAFFGELYFSGAIPFTPRQQEVVYLEGVCQPLMNQYFRKHWSRVENAFHKEWYSFVHIPSLVEELSQENAFEYYDPARPAPQAAVLGKVDGTLLNAFVTAGTMPTACFGCFVEGWTDSPLGETAPGKWRMIYVELDATDPQKCLSCIEPFLVRLKQEEEAVRRKHYDPDAWKNMTRFQLSDRGPAAPRPYSADEEFEKEANELEQELRERISHITRPGMVEAVLRKVLDSYARKPSRLVVTSDGRLLLPDFQNREVKMGALPMALYLLFLELPEGIMLKNLIMHRERLTSLYVGLTNRESGTVILDSVNRLLQPWNNSVNVNITRINQAFRAIMPESLASQYCITGTAGTPKKITLDRQLVVWE